MSIDHYENFPVASVLCPPDLRPAVRAIYHFARTADDIADEGDAPPQARLRDLQAYREDLDATFASTRTSGRWPGVFEQLALARQRYALPHAPLADLLDAFMQDTHNPLYEARDQLQDYCRRSANPIGRLLLHLYGVDDAVSLHQSDAICTALQLINFWQDCSVDLPRNRVYLPLQDARHHGVDLSAPRTLKDSPASRAMIAELCAWAESLMRKGAPLALRLPGRAGWELRLVVLGGLRILEKIARMDYATLRRRPSLVAADYLPLAWQAATMRKANPAT